MIGIQNFRASGGLPPLLFSTQHDVYNLYCILWVKVSLLHVIGKEDTFLQAYVASNLLHVFQLIFVFSFHALPYTKTKKNEKVTVMKI